MSVLPGCTVIKIRDEFPSENVTGFNCPIVHDKISINTQWQKHHFKSGGAENNWGIIKKLLRKSKLRFEDAKKL